MKIRCPETWTKVPGVDYGAATISLNAILPRAGGKTSVGFTRDDRLRRGDVETLLWQPPISALNGWSEQPTEITQSYLVTAKVIGVSQDAEQPPFSLRQYRHDLEIVACEPLLPVLQRLQEGQQCWELAKIADTRTNPTTVFLDWDEVHWCGTARIGGLTYIVANTHCESHMELIIDEVDGEFFGLFSAHINPGGATYDLGRCKLNAREYQAVTQAMHKAFRLADTFPVYLTP